MSEATGLTLNDSLDEDVEYDSLGFEITAENGNRRDSNAQTGASSSSNNQQSSTLSRLIRAKCSALLSIGESQEIEQAVEQEFGFNDDFY